MQVLECKWVRAKVEFRDHQPDQTYHSKQQLAEISPAPQTVPVPIAP